jgi:acyl-CoA synthetase (AMP-forming)/AMP-acid ligase II
LRDADTSILFVPKLFRGVDYEKMVAPLLDSLPALKRVVVVRGDDETLSASSVSYASLLAGPEQVSIARFEGPPKGSTEKLLLYTSGTTGQAKGVVHSRESIRATLISSIEYWGLDEDDRTLMASPVTHITGYLFGLELPFWSGSETLLMPHWNPAQAVNLIREQKATFSIGATPFLKELLDEALHQGTGLPGFRLFVCGGASVPPDLIMRAAAELEDCTACRVFGSTEVPMVSKGYVSRDDLSQAADTDGRIVGYDVKIIPIDEGHDLLPSGSVEEGEICARGDGMFLRYTSAEETARAFDDEGYFRTGDLGRITEEGAITITGRIKDLIIRGGENLSPAEIEAALNRHPAITESSVVGMPHPRLGEGVAAFVRVKEGAEAPTLTEIIEFLDATDIARQKYPERLEYIDDFPRTSSGKVRKDLLRGALASPLTIKAN